MHLAGCAMEQDSQNSNETNLNFHVFAGFLKPVVHPCRDSDTRGVETHSTCKMYADIDVAVLTEYWANRSLAVGDEEIAFPFNETTSKNNVTHSYTVNFTVYIFLPIETFLFLSIFSMCPRLRI